MQREKKIVPVAVAVILDRAAECVLLQRREYTTGVEGMDGMWELPGGKIEFGEQAEEAVRREIMEEIGIDIIVHRLLGVRTNVWRFPDFDGSSLLIAYFCWPLLPSFIPSRENLRWFRINDLNYTTTLPGTREFIEAIFK